MKFVVKVMVAFFMWSFASQVLATAFFETGETQVATTVDNGGWVTVNLQKSYVSPVVIAGPVSHNNTNTLSSRVRNVTSSSFEVGVQSPCESFNQYTGTTPPPNNTCPIGGSWSSETVQWIVIEQGTWVFPDGTKIEAYNHVTDTLRSKSGAGAARDVISFSHTYGAAPAVLHGVSSFNGSQWVATSSWGPGTNRGSLPSTTSFSLTLEGAEAETSHAEEVIGWMAIERTSGTNLGRTYAAGRVGRIIDRHNDECQNISLGVTFASSPNVIAKHNTMSGGDGSFVRLCGAEIETSNFRVHMEEDQVTDADRTGVEEAASWFAFESGRFGVLEFLSADKSVSDEDGDAIGGPGELLTYTVTIINDQDDFAQANNPSSTNPEFVDVLDSNVTFDSVVSASSGTLTYNSGANRMEWQGSVPAVSVVTLVYRVRVNEDMSVCSLSTINNQGQLYMDPIDDGVESGDIDNLNQVVELTDDPSRDDGADADGDTLTDDDDETVIDAGCLVDISVSKSDVSSNYTPGQTSPYTIIVSNAGPHSVVGALVADTLPNGVSVNGAISCTITAGTGSCGAPTISGQDFSQSVDLSANSEATIVIPVSYEENPSNF